MELQFPEDVKDKKLYESARGIYIKKLKNKKTKKPKNKKTKNHKNK